MPSVVMLDASGSRAEKQLSDAVFGVQPNRHVMYEAVKHFRATSRRGTHATKNRALVSGGGKKPWRQKGTGRARVGSSRNPLWRKGGTVFGPQPRDYAYKLNGKVQRGALRSALSLRVKEDALSVASGLELERPSTKTLKKRLEAMGVVPGRVLVVDERPSETLYLSARNLPQVDVRSVAALNAYHVLAAQRIVLSEQAVARLEERLSR
ncbi:MAG TPA: 50S ribosomal protein L4 [Vicinamibacteria bacterium]|nr:50S ribosomal protein L4 [Vicinamibacteria bacterium]